jgi:two-component system phosphate regulon response regulator PhoB
MAQKVAIVEDDLAISQMYRIKFEMEGYTVETAENGKVGLQMVEKFNPDILLLDLMMPEMTGDQMLAEMRKMPWGKNTKVIILTNKGETEAPSSLNKLGVRKYIVKAEMTPRQVADLVKVELES